MDLATFIKVYVVSVPIFFAIDLVWLGVVAKGIYGKYMGHLMRPTPNWAAAVTFYLIFIVGLVIFSIYPALKNSSWSYAALYGAMFGFFTYMTFDLTNLAVLKGYPWQIAIIDIVWGIALSFSVSALSYLICSKYLGL
ncbi:hypothetical protein AMJ57_02165 [Parcubacteria bacterium SG8_24]|nr:MAG: hypothetical protein AMJ57_02165 [Parcubacteria bacterium SG8_24]